VGIPNNNFYLKEALLNLLKPAITIAIIVLTVIGIAYVISILPQSIIWSVVILLIGSFIYLGKRGY
jgi:energy-coupling factor transporter transmembrane protein EcfT